MWKERKENYGKTDNGNERNKQEKRKAGRE